jgi:hypothetical protein
VTAINPLAPLSRQRKCLQIIVTIESACRSCLRGMGWFMQLFAIGSALVALYIIQIVANRLMALTPEKLTKAALRINACNQDFGRRLLELNRQSAGNWAESVNYAHVVTEWGKAVSKLLKHFDYLHHAKENTDYRLPLLLIGEPITIEGVSIPDNFIFRVADSILKEIAKGTKLREDVILKAMSEQISPNGLLATRFWAFRAYLLASGQISAATAPPGKPHDKFALLSALHVSFGLNSRNRLMRSRWNTPRIILETAVYGLFQFVVYFVLWSPNLGHRNQPIIVPGYDVEMGFFELMVFSISIIGLATIWFLIRFRRYVNGRKFQSVIATLLKAGVLARDDLRAYGQGVLGVGVDDGFPWRYD